MSIRVQEQLPGVTPKIDVPLIHRHIVRGHGYVVPARDVVLRADMHKAEGDGRQVRHRVVGVSDAVGAAGLVGNVVADGCVADAGGAVGVLFLLSTKRAGLNPDREFLTRSHLYPSFLSCAAAKFAIAPPRLCPVTTSWKPGFASAALSTAARTRLRDSNQELQKPVCAVQPGQMSVSVAGKLRLASQFLRDWLPRKLTTTSLLVLSTATKPVTSVAKEL